MYDVSVGVTDCDSAEEMMAFVRDSVSVCTGDGLLQMVSNLNHGRYLGIGESDCKAQKAANAIAAVILYETGDSNPRVNQLIRERLFYEHDNRRMRLTPLIETLSSHQQHPLPDDIFLAWHREYLAGVVYILLEVLIPIIC
jgi:hypothetical protein